MNLTKKPYLAYIAIGIFFIAIASSIDSIWQTPAYSLRSLLIQPHKNHIARALFSSEDNIAHTLVDLIAHEKTKIQCAMYFLTNHSIAQALIDAHKRGVIIDIIVHDHSEQREPRSALWKLSKAGISVWTYQFSTQEGTQFPPIMHHKFFIFSNNLDNRTLISTGSFNCTNSAQAKNHENIIIVDDADVIQSFEHHFATLKKSIKPLYASTRK